METSKHVRGFKILTIVGCVGTAVFLVLEAWRENFAGEWRPWQSAYVEKLAQEYKSRFEVGIKQAFLPELGKVDRCQTCHVGIDDPAMAGQEPPLGTHPGNMLAAHPAESFGCTICHQGQGRAIAFDDAHGRVPHWEEPLLDGELVYTSCGRCHADNALYGPLADGQELFAGSVSARVPGAKLLARGKQLVATSGCLGCHAYNGRGGTAGPELTRIGDKGPHGYDFSHLPAGVERTPLEWLKAHFMDPGALSPGTVMPGIGANEADAEALAAYMTSLKSPDVPVAYLARGARARGSDAQLGGEALYELYCVACHGRDLAGSDVPEIRTPSLSNEDFLNVADDAYLTYIIEHGRSGSEMPAWGSGSGGLTAAQIERIVGYIRSFEPDRANAAQVSVASGDVVMGRSLFRGNCASCHGLEGEGGIGTRLNSADFLGLASDEFLTHTVIEGRPGTGMPAWTSLSSDDVSDVLAYVRSWGNRGADVQAVLDYVQSPSSPDARMGARLFRSRCSVCHGADGAGAIGPSLNHENFLSMASDEYLAHALLEGRPGTAMPAWADLSVEDAGDLIAHLRSLNATPYREPAQQVPQGDREHGALLFAQTCAACHGTDAVGGLGPQLRNPVFLAHASDGYLFETISRGRHGTAMRGFLKPGTDSGGKRHGDAGIAELSASQVASIVAWLRSLEHAGPSDAWRAPVLGSASRGKDVYENLGSCAKCHGFEGQGGVGSALGNADFLERASEGFLLGTMVRGRAGTEMRNFSAGGISDLGAEQMMDVAAYVRTLGSELPEGRAGWRRYESTADQIAVGEKFFAHYCAACHGDDGTDGYAPELNNREFLTAASDGLLVATIARGRRGTPMRPFGPGPASLADLSHEEIRAIVAYIRSWETPGDGSSPEIPTATVKRASAREPEH